MQFKIVAACAGLALIVASIAPAEAGDRNRTWCRAQQHSDSPMTWNEGYGVSSCNDRAVTPYRPWNSAAPVPRNQSDPMVAGENWRGSAYFSGYDQRYDDRYDRRSHRYR
jgi:hypothetical protein